MQMQYQPQDFTTSRQVLDLYLSWSPQQRTAYLSASMEGDYDTRDSMDQALNGGVYARNIKRRDLCYIIEHFDANITQGELAI